MIDMILQRCSTSNTETTEMNLHLSRPMATAIACLSIAACASMASAAPATPTSMQTKQTYVSSMTGAGVTNVSDSAVYKTDLAPSLGTGNMKLMKTTDAKTLLAAPDTMGSSAGSGNSMIAINSSSDPDN